MAVREYWDLDLGHRWWSGKECIILYYLADHGGVIYWYVLYW